MVLTINEYKERYQFSLNFYSVFLLVTFIPDIINIDNTLVKNLIWVVRIAFACWVIFKEQDTAFYFTAIQRLYLLVCFIYALNIFVDVYFDPIPSVLSRTDGFMDLVGFGIDLLLALSFRYDRTFDSEKSLKFFWITLALGLLIAFHFVRLTPRLLLFDEDTTRYDANSTVNTIMYGQFGCALCLVSLYLFVISKKLAFKFITIVTLIIGFLSIAKAGSRSPVVVFALVIAFYLAARLGKLKALAIFLVFAALVFLFLNPIIGVLHSFGSNIADRLTNIVVEHDTSGRQEIWENVWGIIKKSPVFGAYYLVPSGVGSGMYPHNFYLEAFMTMGLIGGIPFMILIFFTMGKVYKLIKIEHHTTWILLLYLQILVFGFFSTGLYSSQELWILMFYVLTIRLPEPIITEKVLS